MTAAGAQRHEPPVSYEKLYLAHRDLIRRVAEFAGRRSNFSREDIEDFSSTVEERLIANDYAVLRKHRGDSKLTTFLTAVVHNLFKDYRNSKLGKYRPSAEVKRLGPVAVALDRMLNRDGYPLEAAIQIARHRADVDLTDDELRELAEKLPQREPRRFVSEEVLEQRAYATPGSPAEERVKDGERQEAAQRVESALNTALSSLEPKDLLLLKMHFRDGISFTRIARGLRLERRALYARKDKAMSLLRELIRAEGLTWADVREIVGWQGREIRADFRGVAGREVSEKSDDARSENSGDESVQSPDGDDPGDPR